MTETPHALYLPPAAHRAAAAPTRRALECVEGAAPALRRQLGVTVEVYALRPKDAANPRVAAAFRRRGISSLPALLAGGRAYVGCRKIEDYYSRRLSRGAGARRGAPRDPGGYAGQDYPGSRLTPGADSEEFANDTAEEELDAYMRREMGGGGRLGGIDVSELGYGGGDD